MDRTKQFSGKIAVIITLLLALAWAALALPIYTFEEAFIVSVLMLLVLMIGDAGKRTDDNEERDGLGQIIAYVAYAYIGSGMIHILAVIPLIYMMPYIPYLFIVMAVVTFFFGVLRLVTMKESLVFGLSVVSSFVYYRLYIDVQAYVYPVYHVSFDERVATIGVYGFILIWIFIALVAPVAIAYVIADGFGAITKDDKESIGMDVGVSDDYSNEEQSEREGTPQTVLSQSITKITNVIQFPTHKK